MAIELVGTIEVGAGGAASVQFTSIPQTAKNLLVLASGRHENTQFLMTINNVAAGVNYGDRNIIGSGSSAFSNSNGAGGEKFWVGVQNYPSTTTNTYSNHSITISNYTSTEAYKTVLAEGANENNASEAYAIISGGRILVNSAVSSVEFFGASGNWLQNTVFSLYLIS